MITAWDPGEVRTGFAMFNYFPEERKADLVIMTILNGDEQFYKTLSQVMKVKSKEGEPKHVMVSENFRIGIGAGGAPNPRARRSAAYTGSELQTIRRIGSLQFIAFEAGHEFVIQEPGILGMARKWCDLTLPKGHIPDDKSAYIHGAHYMMNKGLIDSVDDIRKHGQEVLS